jgi:hypothetical protein
MGNATTNMRQTLYRLSQVPSSAPEYDRAQVIIKTWPARFTELLRLRQHGLTTTRPVLWPALLTTNRHRTYGLFERPIKRLVHVSLSLQHRRHATTVKPWATRRTPVVRRSLALDSRTPNIRNLG